MFSFETFNLKYKKIRSIYIQMVLARHFCLSKNNSEVVENNSVIRKEEFTV